MMTDPFMIPFLTFGEEPWISYVCISEISHMGKEPGDKMRLYMRNGEYIILDLFQMTRMCKQMKLAREAGIIITFDQPKKGND